ncbi:MAG: sigma-70 family RNA polymerase sigma factor [Nitrospinae bacterium]|nr:sigma-70 family RNA polymerase sigma factor [Nitrospinota bacterium]
MRNMDEARIVEKARNGDQEAFGVLFEQYKNMVWSVAYRMTYDFDEAEDLAQDVFVSAWKNLGSFRGDSSFSTWLYRITANKSLNHAGKRKNVRVVPGEETMAKVDEAMFMRNNPQLSIEQMETEKTLAEFLGRLEPERRLAVILRELEGLSYEEIAEATKVPVGTVRSRLARGRRELEEMAAGSGDRQ